MQEKFYVLRNDFYAIKKKIEMSHAEWKMRLFYFVFPTTLMFQDKLRNVTYLPRFFLSFSIDILRKRECWKVLQGC